MRLWSLHPRYLDPKGIVALWREALLAQAVIAGRTTGYRHHPQLERFLAVADPGAAIRRYLEVVLSQARSRGYAFDEHRIDPRGSTRLVNHDEGRCLLEVTVGQLRYERRLLAGKLAKRAPASLALLDHSLDPLPHPLFRPVPGEIEPWEHVKELPSDEQRQAHRRG